MRTLDDAFKHTLKDVYYAENALTKALPKVAKAVSNKALKTAIEDHLEETKRQVKTHFLRKAGGALVAPPTFGYDRHPGTITNVSVHIQVRRTGCCGASGACAGGDRAQG